MTEILGSLDEFKKIDLKTAELFDQIKDTSRDNLTYIEVCGTDNGIKVACDSKNTGDFNPFKNFFNFDEHLTIVEDTLTNERLFIPDNV